MISAWWLLVALLVGGLGGGLLMALMLTGREDALPPEIAERQANADALFDNLPHRRDGTLAMHESTITGIGWEPPK